METDINCFLRDRVNRTIGLFELLSKVADITSSQGAVLFIKEPAMEGHTKTAPYTQLAGGAVVGGIWKAQQYQLVKIIESVLISKNIVEGAGLPQLACCGVPVTEDGVTVLGLLVLSRYDSIKVYTEFEVTVIPPWLTVLQLILQKERLALEVKRLDIYSTSELAKTLILANISHEIRTPLNGIVGYSQLLMQTQLNVTQQSFITSLSKCSMQLLQIMNDILDFSKLSSGKMPVNEEYFVVKELESMMTDTMGSKLHEKKQNFTFNVDDVVPAYVISDKHKIVQILVNLVSNANKFTRVGGSINVSMSTNPIEKKLTFAVKDDGIGISDTDQCKLFNSFIQIEHSRYKTGTGLGLFISRKLSELLGGSISVSSLPGRGSTFTFSVAYKEHNTLLLRHEVATDLAIFKDKYVLVVDDNADNRILISQLVSDLLMIPIACSSALEAVRTVMTNRYPFSLGLIDIHMPGVSGDELAKLLKEEYPFFRMIALSSYDSMVNSNLFEDKLDKPLDKILLYNAIYTLLRKEAEDGFDSVTVSNLSFKRNVRFLIAEDVQYNANMLVSMLESLGYGDVRTFPNGADLVAYVENCRNDTNRPFEIVLLDLLMPIMDGFEVLEYFSVHGIKIPVIAITASVMEESRVRCKEIGVKFFLNKPIKIKELREALQVISSSLM